MTTRRLAAILAADVVGFSSMIEQDEPAPPCSRDAALAGFPVPQTTGGISLRWPCSPARGSLSGPRLY